MKIIHTGVLYTQYLQYLMKRTILIFSTLLLLTACGATTSNVGTSTNMATQTQTGPPKSGEQIAVVKTNMGTIKIKFFPQYAPETIKNFTELAKKGFFDGLIFHRVIPDFMIQGGDPLGTGYGGETYKGPGTHLPGEVSDKVTHVLGAVSMANSGSPDTASSQFFIVQNRAGAHFLDGKYTIFGQAYEGLDTVDAIANTPRDANDKPKSKVTMEKITLETVP